MTNTGTATGSTWSGFFSKLGVLLPHMWPKKSLALQFRVLLCVLLLATVRVINVFVPLFYKKIGKSRFICHSAHIYNCLLYTSDAADE